MRNLPPLPPALSAGPAASQQGGTCPSFTALPPQSLLGVEVPCAALSIAGPWLVDSLSHRALRGPGARPVARAAGGRAASSSCHSGEVRRAEGARGRGGRASERCAVRTGAAGRAAARAVCGRCCPAWSGAGGRAGGAGCGGRGVPRDSPEARPAARLVPFWVPRSCLGQRTGDSELDSDFSEAPCVPAGRRTYRGHCLLMNSVKELFSVSCCLSV